MHHCHFSIATAGKSFAYYCTYCVWVWVCVCVFPTVEVVGIVCIQVCRYLFLVEVHQSLLELHFTS